MSQRLDKWLVYARFVKHRGLAQSLIEEGQVRVNRVRVAKCSQTIKPDDVLTLSLPSGVRVVRVLGEAERWGSAPVARQLYQEIVPAENQDARPEALC